MELSARQNDALTELINIGFARAAASLSELTGHRVLLEAPQVAICPISDLNKVLGDHIQEETVTVHQLFSGLVSGDALLLLDYNGAVILKELLTDEPAIANRLDASGREVLTEVGNILLNACLGLFGNLLRVHVTFSVPRLHLDTLKSVLHSLVIEQEGLRYALVVFTTFRMRDGAVSGYLVMMLGVSSLDRFIQEIERSDEHQSQG
jgi:chemotaxis protein CheC